jgi:hypothetical protein
MQSGHIGKANDLVSWTYMCLHDLLCQSGAGIRITETKRKLILEFKGTYDKNSHRLRIMHEGFSAPGVGGIKSYMSDNRDSDSDNSAKFQAFNFIRSKIPYSPVLQELRREGNAESLYRQNLNGISDSYSDSDSDEFGAAADMCPAGQISQAHQRFASWRGIFRAGGRDRGRVCH